MLLILDGIKMDFAQRLIFAKNMMVIWLVAVMLFLSGCVLEDGLAALQTRAGETPVDETDQEVAVDTLAGETAQSTEAPALVVPVSIPGRVTASSMRVRSGPGTEYLMIAGVRFDAAVEITGRTADNTWLLSELGWLFAEYVEVDGDLNSLPVLYEFNSGLPSPTPITPTPKPEE